MDIASLDSAIAHHQAGRFEAAEAIYTQILEHDPDNLDALNLYGVLLQESDRLPESLTLLNRACTLDPAFPEALANLARAQNATGDYTSAAASARQAIAHDPELAEAHLQLGWSLLALGENVEALAVCRHAVRLDPTQHDAYSQLGAALLRAGDFAAAADAFAAALRLAPDRLETWLSLGGALTETGDFAAAERTFRDAIARAPADVRGHAALGRLLYRAGDVPAAIEANARALELAPDRADLWEQQGENHMVTGHFDQAATCFRRVLALAPGSPAALEALVRMDRLAEADEHLGNLRSLLQNVALPAAERIAAGFALGAALDRAQSYDEAFAAFDAANRLVRETSGPAPDPAFFAEQVNRLIAAFGPEAFSATRGWGDPSEVPVFVVGMPRSGTTLVEQIAASHGRVHGAGERKDLLAITHRLMSGAAGQRPAAWDRSVVRQAATEQVARLLEIGGDADRVIDKLPDNVLMLGVAAILFPNARVVICRRDPRDVGLSCFFHHFSDAMPWTNDLAACGARARAVDRLIAHWREVLPLRMHEVQYEALVADLEGESRRLIAFLDLDWDPACLAFHRTERTVMSASRWQVRQPLFATSVGRWRAYAHHLAPLIDALGPLVRSHETALPADVDSLFRHGRQLLDQDDAATAAAVFRQAVEKAPGVADLHHYLGMALTRRSEHAAAAEALRAALALRPDSAEIMSKLAWSLSRIGQESESLHYHQRAIALAPHEPRVSLGLLLFHYYRQDIAAMKAAALEAVERMPDNAELWLYLGHAQAAQGDFTAAGDSYRRALHIDPERGDAQAGLVSIGEHFEPPAAPHGTTSSDPGRTRAERCAAAFARGASLDKAGEYDAAFEAFGEANRLARAEYAATGQVFDPAEFARGIAARIAAYTPDAFLAMAGRGNLSHLPVFVVGMPRSGTTLVEQIAASHPRVFGAGELDDIGAIVSRMEAGRPYLPPTGWDQPRMRQEVASYLEKIGQRGQMADRVVDKMPGNIQHLGQIAMMLPNARIVLCRRDLRDVCLSCFMQHFAGALPWTTDLNDLATYAAGIDRLAAHWLAVLPSRVLVMQYETLVADLEGQSRRLIDFLGLEWDPACLDFHRTERAVTTASLWQVRQPLYNTSVGRWRHYAKHLGPLLAGLSGLDIPAV